MGKSPHDDGFRGISIFVDPPHLFEHSPKAHGRVLESARAPVVPHTLSMSCGPAWMMGSWPPGEDSLSKDVKVLLEMASFGRVSGHFELSHLLFP